MILYLLYLNELKNQGIMVGIGFNKQEISCIKYWLLYFEMKSYVLCDLYQ